MKKTVFMLCLMATTLLACHKHAAETDAYEVAIAIKKPTADGVAPLNQIMPVEVTFTRNGGGLIHNVLIQIIDSKGVVSTTVKSGHVHESSPYNYVEAAALKPTIAGDYTLKVTTTDDAQLQPNVKEQKFTVK
jgi:hypothetical protein